MFFNKHWLRGVLTALAAGQRVLGRNTIPSRRRGTPRTQHRFQIGPNSHPRKVQRWFRLGGGIVLKPEEMAIAAARHVHPRRKRFSRSVHVGG